MKGLKRLGNKSIDLVFFDPPYNAAKDYEIYKDLKPEAQYQIWMGWIIEECKRVTKRGIGIYVDSWRFRLYFQWLLPESEPIIIWKKSPSFASEKNLLGCFHVILTNAKATKNVRNLWHDITLASDGYYFKEKKYKHPAQTSLKATRRFVENFSEKGELILDPFAGVGTTWAACHQLDRRFLGFEINPDYIKIAKKRINKRIDDYFE